MVTHHVRIGSVENRPALTRLAGKARTGADTVSVAIGLRQDGQLVTTMGTPERRQQPWVVWESCWPGAGTTYPISLWRPAESRLLGI